MLASTIAFAALLGCAVMSAPTDDYKYNLLSKERPNINFVAYTPAQRTEVAESMVKMLSVYVNRESKILNYAATFPTIDPLPRAAALAKKAAGMTDMDFHYSFAALFLSLRDFHTRYDMPGPHRCYTALQAASFTVIEHNAPTKGVTPQKFVVKGFSRHKELIAKSGAALSVMNPGDEIITIDGKTPDQYVKDAAFTAGGANEFGNLRAALVAMSARTGRIYPMPTDDGVTYKLKSLKTRKLYTTTLPWIVRSDNSCIAETDAFRAGTAPRPKVSAPGTIVSERLNDFKEMFANGAEAANIFVHSTVEPILSWAIYKNKMGVIYLRSFTPSNDNAMAVTLQIRDLLNRELAETDCVIFDVRDNGGGLVRMADLIPQLFAPSIVTISARAIVAPINANIFKHYSSKNPWAISYGNRVSGEVYTPLVKFTQNQDANTVGMAYAKPVGVFTNGSTIQKLTLDCYSACEVFAANMKDNHAATIFGEDGSTGGGGAAIAEYFFFNSINGADFPPMPYLDEMPKSHQDSRIGWRQFVRTGPNNGKLIEDIGITSDVRIRPFVADLLTTSNTQFDFILNEFEYQGRRNGERLKSFQISPQQTADVDVDAPVEFLLQLKGVKSVTVLDAAGVERASLSVSSTQLRLTSHHQIWFASGVSVIGINRYTIVGKDALQRPVFSTYRFIRTVPTHESFVKITPGSVTTLNFASSIASYGQFDTHTAPTDAWNRIDGMLIVGGTGGPYALNVDTNAVFFFTSPVVGTKVNAAIHATYDTEQGYDFFFISYIDSTGTHQFGTGSDAKGVPNQSWSEKGVIDQSFTFTPVGDFQLSFRFTSDGVGVATGVTVHRVVISA